MLTNADVEIGIQVVAPLKTESEDSLDLNIYHVNIYHVIDFYLMHRTIRPDVKSPDCKKHVRILRFSSRNIKR